MECCILSLALASSACESDRQLQQVSPPVAAIAPVDIFSEAEVVSSLVRSETSDAYCNLLDDVLFKARLLAAVNQLRATQQQCGDQIFPASHPLVWNVKLQRAAFGHSAQMAMSNLVSHFSLDAQRPADRVRAMGYRFSALGENICAGEFDIPSVIKAWLESPSHCKLMLSPDYSELGVACVRREKSYYRRYWTMNLASPLLEPVPASK